MPAGSQAVPYPQTMPPSCVCTTQQTQAVSRQFAARIAKAFVGIAKVYLASMSSVAHTSPFGCLHITTEMILNTFCCDLHAHAMRKNGSTWDVEDALQLQKPPKNGRGYLETAGSK